MRTSPVKPMALIRWVALALSVGMGSAHGESTPARGATDGRIRTATYSAEDIYRLYGYVGYAIELIFEDGETFSGNGGGDLEAITFGFHDNHVILKPKAANVGTNLVIYTNRRAYRFEYSATTRKPDPRIDPVMYAVRFLYPDSPSIDHARQAAEETQFDLARAGAARPQNMDYWFCGSPEIKPIAASDDGIHTRLSFGAKAELPAIFVRNADESESLLNFSMEEGDVIIHRVAARFILRRGALTGCIVNKDFSGGGERLKSGTVAPGVQRERKDGAP